MENGDVLEPYGNCGACRNRIRRPEEVTYFFDKQFARKAITAKPKVTLGLTLTRSEYSCGPEDEGSLSRHP
jgi:hypothetical protein